MYTCIDIRVLQVDFIKNCGNDSQCDSNLLVRGILELDRLDCSDQDLSEVESNYAPSLQC